MKIEFKDVSFSYDKNEGEVLNNISFTIESNKMTAIIGRNGSGKSTIAKLITGLLIPSSGNIYIDEVEYTESNVDDIRRKIGIIFQNPDNQFVGSTVADDIAFGLENQCLAPSEIKARIDKYSKMTKMDKFLEYNPEQLSGGQKQRVALAGALAMETDLIIFDESTSMLDPQGVKEITKVIKNLKQEVNKTIITITHNIEEVLTADSVIILDEGRIIKQGCPKEVLSDMSLLDSLGLDTPECVKLISLIKEMNISDSDKWEKILWELAFKM